MRWNSAKLAFTAIFACGTFTVASPAIATICVGTYQQCLDLGIDKNYGIVALGNGKTFNINSGPITGGVLVGNHVVTSSSGGNNGHIDNLYTDGTATGDLFTSLQNGVGSTTTVPTSLTASAFLSATNVSAYAAALTPILTFSSLTGTQIFNGNGGLNVYDVTGNMQNVLLTLNGGANDYYVFNISGNLQTNQPMTLGAGLDPNHILFNLLGTTGNILQTSGGNVLYGTFLATHGGDFQFSELNLHGELINTAGGIQFVSGSQLTYTPPAVPEPATWAMMLLGFGAIGASMRYRRRRTIAVAS